MVTSELGQSGSFSASLTIDGLLVDLIGGDDLLLPRTETDTDGDGFPDSVDSCPLVSGSNNGCPATPTDSDGDGFPDITDGCPLVAGTNNGCPPGVIPQPQAPPPITIGSYYAALRPRIFEYFNPIFSIIQLFSVTGTETTTTGVISAYAIDFSVPYDHDYTDGNVTFEYGSWILSNESADLLLEGVWDMVPNGIYLTSIELIFPKPGEYVLIPFIQQHKLMWDGSSWAPVDFEFINDDPPKRIVVTGVEMNITFINQTGQNQTTNEPVVITLVNSTTTGITTWVTSTRTATITSQTSPQTPVARTVRPDQIIQQKDIVAENTIIIVSSLLVIGFVLYFMFRKKGR